MQTSASASLANRPPFAGISYEVGKPDSPVQRGSAHERLRACIGDWRASGKLDAGGEMHCLESYSWVPGEFFIEYRFDRDVGGGIIWRSDPPKKVCTYCWRAERLAAAGDVVAE